MRIYALIVGALIACACPKTLALTGEEVLHEYQSRFDRKNDDNREALKYLESLNCDEFLQFIRFLGKDHSVLGEPAAVGLTMAVFARSYLRGPGNADSVDALMAQMVDSTLPVEWREGLLDCLRLPRKELSAAELGTVCSSLLEAVKSESETKKFRLFVLRKLNNVLLTQYERLVAHGGPLADALVSGDRGQVELLKDSKIDPALVSRAVTVMRCNDAMKVYIEDLALRSEDHDFLGLLKAGLLPRPTQPMDR